MDFVSNKQPQIQEMLQALGIEDVAALFRDVPPHLFLEAPSVDDGLSEFEGMRLIETLAEKNTFAKTFSYLGGGAYEHHVPALVNALCSKSEFLTSYTPYQAEASQGMLQAIFEFQSAICALTGMDVANASIYDGASACAEALLMTLRHQPEKNHVLISQTVHPHYLEVVENYLNQDGFRVELIPFLQNGTIDRKALKELLSEKTAGVLLQTPNFFGVIEELQEVIHDIKKVGALAVLCANPLSYGLFPSAGDLQVDIAVGDCQPFGIPLQFGGPYVGYFACRKDLVRQMPGRLVGETTDAQGRRGFVLTLQTREQHIRREKATSNICTNQALAALASLIAILWYGKEGIRKLALTNYQRAAYLKQHLEKIPGIKSLNSGVFFNEFAIRFSQPIEEVHTHFRKEGIEPGIALGRFFPGLKNYLLVAVTETKSKQQLDHYIRVASSFGSLI